MIGSNDELGHSCENNGPGAAEVNQELHKRRHCSTGNHIRFGAEFEKTYSLFPNVSHVFLDNFWYGEKYGLLRK